MIQHKDLEKQISSDTVWVADNKFWVHLKKQFSLIKRFKLVELIHTDIEIKTKGQEIISLGENIYGLVQWYQNIKLYETIDFEKPVGGMGIGMMPSKLALTLINIGVGQYESYSKSSIQNSELTIWDPFCGFGTTNFLANHLWYNTIGSDINPTQAKHNRKRRTTLSTLWTWNTLWTFLKHDVTQPLKSPILRNGNIIVSEGRLGHIVTNKTAHNEVILFSKDVESTYIFFFTHLTDFMTTHSKTIVIVITIPTWLKHDVSISQSINDHANSLWRTTILLEKPYSREKQLVGRQILIANFWT